MDWVKFDAQLARDGSVPPVEKALYAALASFADQGDRETPTGWDWQDDVPTRTVLAGCIGKSKDTVDRATKGLEARGLLEVERRQDPDNPRLNIPSVYRLLDQERWDDRAAERAARRRAARSGGGRMDAARGGRMDAARGGRMDAARGGRMDAA
ncbi:helix-turn-helix domain-containing protein, partial [Streptomyces sp. NPDC093223]|uniref:helix-turn-helix domain-containing protein n=1 Tax=Streptomyces sp. NPDC093223 TaxID=3366033 RepID=UPI00380A36A6